MSTNANFWNALAEKYDRKPVSNPEAFERKFAIIKYKISTKDIILDLGCGTGSLASELATFAAEVSGLDLSCEIIHIATHRART